MTANVILMGGGVKSAVTAARVADSELILLHINYGQPSAGSEQRAIQALARTLPRAHTFPIDLPYIPKLSAGGVEQVLGRDSKGAEGEGLEGGGKASVSPAALRGLLPVMISIAGQVAIRFGAGSVMLGVSRLCDAGHIGLPLSEGRAPSLREFIHACDVMMDLLLRPRVRIRVECPLMEVRYGDIIRLAQRFRIPFEHTWSCLQSGLQPCNGCAGCCARTMACADAACDAGQDAMASKGKAVALKGEVAGSGPQ